MTNKEEIHLYVSIQVLTLYMLLQDEFLAHMFGNMVLRRLNTMHTLTSHITNRSASKNKCKLKTKLIKSFLKVIQSQSILKTKKMPSKNMVSTSTKEVLFLEILSES